MLLQNKMIEFFYFFHGFLCFNLFLRFFCESRFLKVSQWMMNYLRMAKDMNFLFIHKPKHITKHTINATKKKHFMLLRIFYNFYNLRLSLN